MIGIIGAMESEIEILKKRIEDKKEINVGKFVFNTGKLAGKDVVVWRSGVGKVAAATGATTMINMFHPDVIINTGIAGGKNVKRHSITLPTKFYYSDVDVTAFGYKLGQMPGCNEYFEADPKYLLLAKKALKFLNLEAEEVSSLAGDSFITSSKQLKFDLDGKVAYEMEGAGFAHATSLLNVPFIAIRFISDLIGTDNQLDDYNEFEANAAQISNEIIMNVIKDL